MKKTLLLTSLLLLLVSCGGEKLYNKGCYIVPGVYFKYYQENEYYLILTPIGDSERQASQSKNVVTDRDAKRYNKDYKITLYRKIENFYTYYDFDGLTLYKLEYDPELCYLDKYHNAFIPQSNRSVYHVTIAHKDIAGIDGYLDFSYFDSLEE